MARIHWIGGDKGGVGRTLTACLVAQHSIDHGQRWCGFDTGGALGGFARRYAPGVRLLDLSVPNALDIVVDTLGADPGRLVVDLPAHHGPLLRDWMDAGRVSDLLATGGHSLMHWHVLDNSKDALRALYAALDRTPSQEPLTVVLNHGRSRHFMLFEDSNLRSEIAGRGGSVIALPRLEAGAMSGIDAYDKSFWAAVHNEDRGLGPCLTPMQRQRTRVYLETCYQALDAVLAAPAGLAVTETARDDPAGNPLRA